MRTAFVRSKRLDLATFKNYHHTRITPHGFYPTNHYKLLLCCLFKVLQVNLTRKGNTMWSTVYSVSTILIIYNLYSDAYANAINDFHVLTLIYELTASGEKAISSFLNYWATLKCTFEIPEDLNFHSLTGGIIYGKGKRLEIVDIHVFEVFNH